MIRGHGLVGACLLVALAGCSKEKLDELVQKSKEQLDKGIEQVEEATGEMGSELSSKAEAVVDDARQQLPLNGEMQLVIESPVTVPGCYVTFIDAVGGRPSVLQLKSYRSAEAETFPSVLLQATVEASDPSALQGQTVSAQMFVQVAADGPVWFADRTHPVQLKIVTVADRKFTAELVGGALASTHSGNSIPASGKFNGVAN